MKKILLIIITIILCSSVANAKPTIQSVAKSGGNWEIVSTNDDFGVFDVSDIEYIQPDIDAATIGTVFSKVNWFKFPDVVIESNPTITGNNHSGSGQGVRITYQVEYRGSLGYDTGGLIDNIYVTFYRKVDLGVGTGTAAQWKGWRMSENTTGNVGSYGYKHINFWNSTVPSFNQQQIGIEVADVSQNGDCGMVNFNVNVGSEIPNDVYVRQESYITSGSGDGAADGSFKETMLDGTTVKVQGDCGSVVTSVTGPAPWQSVMFGTLGGSVGTTTKSMTLDFDGIYISPEQTRTELSTASTWDEGATVDREIQVESAHAIGAITATIIQGAIPDGTAYLYVIDANGDISDYDGGTAGDQGYPVTLAPAPTGGAPAKLGTGSDMNLGSGSVMNILE